MPRAHHTPPVDGLDHVPYAHLRQPRHNAPRLDPLHEGVPRPVVCDRQPESHLVFADGDLLGVALDVRENEVFQPDLSPQEVSHVHLVRVERAEDYLQRMEVGKTCNSGLKLRLPLPIPWVWRVWE